MKEISDIHSATHPFIVQRETSSGRTFIGFTSVDEFWDWYRCVNKHQGLIAEVIRDAPQKVRFDIDNVDTQLTGNQIIEAIVKEANNTDPRLKPIVFSICSDATSRVAKISYHITFTGVAYVNRASAEHIFNTIFKSLNPSISKYIDTGMYKAIQMFRLEGSSKKGEFRFKRPINGRALETKEQFLNGLITWVGDCIIETSVYIQEKPKERVVLAPIQSNYKLDCCTVVFGDVEYKIGGYKPHFKIRNIPKNNRSVLLDRCQPSLCINCKRIHTNDNASLLVTENGLYFRCFRNSLVTSKVTIKNDK